MSGHSKWAITKHEKAAIDAKRDKLFARLIKNIEVAARAGGGDPADNPTLFDTIQKTGKNSVPANNIARAVKRGPGAEASGASYETVIYESYGLGGVVFYVGCLANNRNRTASDVRLAFTRSDGFIANPGSVTFLFSCHGIVEVAAAEGVDEDSAIEAVLGAGTEEVEDLGGGLVTKPDPSDVAGVRKALQAADIDYDFVEVQLVAVTEVELGLEGAVKVQRPADILENLDDVQNIYYNITVSGEVQA